jgi:hypothetical protein
MPVSSEKEEVRMRRGRYGALRWSFAPVTPGTEARFRRWNIVLIVILAFLVLGVFVAGKAPEPESYASNRTSVSLKAGKAHDLTSPRQFKSNKTQPQAHNRERPPAG